jgi:hypothetical protein
MEEQWARGRSSPDQGLAITAGEVERILQPTEQARIEAETFAARPDVAALTGPLAAADAALLADPGWAGLCGHFAIPTQERDLLALVLAEALDPEFGRVLAYLHDDVRRTRATPWLAAQLNPNPQDVDAPPSSGENLLTWRLAGPVETQGPVLPSTLFQADPATLHAVITGAWTDPKLRGIAEVADNAEIAAMPVLYPVALERMIAAATGGAPVTIDLLGAKGIGRRVLATQFAAATGRRLLVADVAALVASREPAVDFIVAVLRMARAIGAAILWRHAERWPSETFPAELAAGLDTLRALPAEAITRPDAIGIVLEKPSMSTGLMVWRHLSDDPPPLVVTTQRLTPGEIALAAHAAPGGEAAVRLALRRSGPPDGDVLSHLSCPYGWEDLVAPPEMHAQLRELEAQIRLRWEVYEEWGFARLVHLGTGIAALFAGPSGTGKTMAAQIVAGALNLDLYRVDLAGVINKYVGETEKRLRDVFAFGERAGVVLFFDEADSLFGSRMQVKDSHDRFANIEIDYLLQRIERFDGIAILATNRKADVDTAFLRRLRFVVDFAPPGPAERLAIWRRALPEATPSGDPLLDNIDWALLADQLHLTGADIKSAALAAAFLARGDGTRIGMRHVLAGAQRELAKRGQVLRLQSARATGT